MPLTLTCRRCDITSAPKPKTNSPPPQRITPASAVTPGEHVLARIRHHNRTTS